MTLTIGFVVLFATLCAIYRLVPRRACRGRPIWPGAVGATVAIGIVDLGFPLYLDNISTLRIGTSAVFVLIALVWFYVIALILLAGAVVNELRFEHVSRYSYPRRGRRLKTAARRLEYAGRLPSMELRQGRASWRYGAVAGRFARSPGGG